MLTAAECLEVIRRAYPELKVHSYTFDRRGQNNDILIVNGDLVFRFPRTARAARQLRVETAILSRLQGRTTLQVPNPIYLSLGPEVPPGKGAVRTGTIGTVTATGTVGPTTATGVTAGTTNGVFEGPTWTRPLRGRVGPRHRPRPVAEPDHAPGQRGPDGRMPWERGLGGRLPWEREKEERERRGSPAGRPPGTQGVFVGYRRIPGEPLWRDTLLATVDPGTVQAWADQLGTFLTELHSTPVEGNLAQMLRPFNSRSRWEDFYRRVREKVFPHMRPDARTQVSRMLESFLGDPSNFEHPFVLVHGDFGPSNILLDRKAQRVTGVIDFGSSGLDDPAVDLAALLGPFSYGEAFLRRLARTYPVTQELVERAKFYAATFPLQDAVYGIENNDPEAFKWGMAPYR